MSSHASDEAAQKTRKQRRDERRKNDAEQNGMLNHGAEAVSG
jgi:hypothetical protein